jgi:hypothetical protein
MHACSTVFMMGLIWFVQIVHYPLTGSVGAGSLATYQAEHMRRTSWVVGPPMLVEAATTAWLLLEQPAGVPAWILSAGAGLLVAVWMSTALLQVPAHNRLLTEGSTQAVPRLVATNWIRTIGWTARAGLALWVLILVTRATVTSGG